jgi:hypothetical protein
MGKQKWTVEEANAWYRCIPWPVGCNFIPSCAINQLEMWQAATFDPHTISRELNWASQLGFNTIRVYLHDLAWQSEPEGFLQRIRHFLDIADHQKIRTIFVLFDDCWNPDPAIGEQPQPQPGVHNSGWVQSPGQRVVLNPEEWPRLEAYVKAILGALGNDERILMWDLYNEPGNKGMGERSLGLLRAEFQWAREANPQQPLTAPIWFDNQVMNTFQLEASDIITFHNYDDTASLEAQIADLKSHLRPLICTEYMARSRGSRFATHLPVFHREAVGCMSWGLVAGKTNTIFPWESASGSAEPAQWFHDIFYPDGTPYDQEEILAIRRWTGA